MKVLWRRHKMTFIAAGLVVCMTVALGAGIGWSRSCIEKDVAKAADDRIASKESGEEESGRFSLTIGEDTLYKDWVEDQEIVKQVCEKYNLDYDTVCIGDMTKEMRDYEEALWLLKNMGNQPLLMKSGQTIESPAFESLEVYIDDIYAFDGGKTVIIEMCKGFGIDAENAVISDLSVDQLIRIGEEAYDTSDHPKE